MRFEVSKVLDAIESRLCTDPALARAVVDLSEVVRYADLDGGRPASLLRLGLVVDALARHLSEENVQVYVVVPRALLSDADLTSNERMVARRWADDGLVEVVPELGDRVLEVADLLGLPVVSRSRFDALRDRHPWVAAEPGRILSPVPGVGGPVMVSRGGGALPPVAEPSLMGARLLARLWRCTEPDCTGFGAPGGGDGAFADLRTVTRPSAQPPPTLAAGAPTCPRHGTRLSDVGPRPPVEVLAARIGGVVRQRFVVSADHPVVVGRAPEDGDGIMLGQWLTDEARRWISRSHVRFELRGRDLLAQDVSTNGTGVRPGGSMNDDERITLGRQQSRALAGGDVVELYPDVHVGRARNWASGGVTEPASVMGEAPTVAIRVIDHR